MASYAGSAIQGAGTGAAMGSVAGPWGAAIGGALGLVAGIFSAYDAEQDARRKQELLDEIKQQFNMDQQEVENLLQQYYNNPDNFLGTKEDVDAYKAAVATYNPQDYVLSEDQVKYKGYDKTVDDFITPYYDKIIQDTTDRVQHSAAGAGVGRGTGAANAIATAAAEKEDELYKTALQQYNTDRAQSYTEWAGEVDRLQNRLNQLKGATDTQLSLQNNLATSYLNTKQQESADKVAAAQNRANGNLSLASMSLMV